MDQMTSFEGDTGPYLQYAHARVCSIKRKAGLSDEEIASADFSLLTEAHAVNIVRLLAQWPDVFSNTLRTLEPTTVLAYLFKMTHALSSSYDVLRIMGSEPAVLKARMALYEAAHIVLGNGMRLLGLSPVERYVSIPSYTSLTSFLVVVHDTDTFLVCKFVCFLSGSGGEAWCHDGIVGTKSNE